MKQLLLFISFILFLQCNPGNDILPTKGNCEYFVLEKHQLLEEAHHLNHYEFFSRHIDGLNQYILKGIDKVQASAMDGGGYFIGIKANPPESPIGYNLRFFDTELLVAPRTTSYCSGASYAAFIEGMNLISTKLKIEKPDSNHLEAFRMQEIDNSRREDHVKFWGKWNADGFGNHFSLVQYSGIGEVVSPAQARPGDFANISWKSGVGHSVVFLAWVKDNNGKKYLLYWSSQKGTNGLGDQLVSLEKIDNIKIVRLVNPVALGTFDVYNEKTDLKIKGDEILF